MEFDSSFFDAGLERRHTDCEKWDGMADEHHDPEMIPMWVADMDFRSRHCGRGEAGGRTGHVGLHAQR